MVTASDGPFERGELEELVRRHMPESADAICQALLPGVEFVHGVASERVALRLGGGAFLPTSVEWPANGDRDLYHLATVDLGVVGPLDLTSSLPDAGFLLFFYDLIGRSWGLDPSESAAWRVMWLNDPAADSLPARHRRPHPTDSRFAVDTEIEPEVVSSAARTWTMPMEYEPCVASTFYAQHGRPEYRARVDDFEAMRVAKSSGFLMLGWPYYEQPNSRQWEVAACSSGRSVEDLDTAEVAEWRLLMQFDCWNSDGGTNWGGPGGGMLEYWIKDADLRARRFDRAWIQVDAC